MTDAPAHRNVFAINIAANDFNALHFNEWRKFFEADRQEAIV